MPLALARYQKVGSCFIAGLPPGGSRRSAVTSRQGRRRSSASRAASSEPARKRAFAQISASTASRATTVARSRSLSAGSPVPGSIRWCSSRPPRRQARRSRPEVARAAVLERERQRAVRRFDADRPRGAPQGDVAARIDEAGARLGEERRCPFGGIALADAAEIELHALAEVDARSRDAHLAPAWPARLRGRAVVGQLVKGSVVAGSGDRVVHGRVEAAVGPLAAVELQGRRPRPARARPRASRPRSAPRARSRGRKRVMIASSRWNSASAASNAAPAASAAESSSICVPMARKTCFCIRKTPKKWRGRR